MADQERFDYIPGLDRGYVEKVAKETAATLDTLHPLLLAHGRSQAGKPTVTFSSSGLTKDDIKGKFTVMEKANNALYAQFFPEEFTVDQRDLPGTGILSLDYVDADKQKNIKETLGVDANAYLTIGLHTNPITTSLVKNAGSYFDLLSIYFFDKAGNVAKLAQYQKEIDSLEENPAIRQLQLATKSPQNMKLVSAPFTGNDFELISRRLAYIQSLLKSNQ